MLTLWGRQTSCNVQKVLWCLEELGQPYRHIEAGGDFGGLEEPAYRAMNPHGRVPTLKDGETVVWESDAILRYLAERYGQETLWAADPGARAGADQWICWTAAHLYRDWIDLFWRFVRTPPARHDKDLIARLKRNCEARYATLDHELAGRPYLAGLDFSLADIPAGMTLYRWFEMAIERTPLPHLEAWYRRLLQRPAYRKAVCLPFDDLIGKEAF